MRIVMTLLTAALVALAGPACKKKDSKPTGGETTGSAAAGSGSAATGSADSGSAGSAAAAGSGSDSGSAAPQMAKKAGNCPSTVLGASTKVEQKGKDLVLTITSTDADAIASIQRRTEELLAEKKDAPPAGGGHDQKGTHGGGAGLCPVYVPDGATATAKNEKDGVAITITAKDKPDELKNEIDARIAKTEEFVKANIKPGDQGNQGGVGGGKGEHGGNHSGEGDAKGKERKGGDGKGGGEGTGGGGSKGTGGGGGDKKAKK